MAAFLLDDDVRVRNDVGRNLQAELVLALRRLCGNRFCVDAAAAYRIVSQRFERVLDRLRVEAIMIAPLFTRAYAANQSRKAFDRVSEHTLRGARQRRTVVRQRKECLLERTRSLRNHREPARAMNAAKRVARAHHLG